jgi:predicted acyltransferase
MNQRYFSLDVFRGMTVALMILVNTPGSWDHIYAPLDHAEWHGLTPTDLVFPFFLFAVGNAMAFVMPKLYKQGDASFWAKVIKRTLIIFGIGLLLNWLPFVKWIASGLDGKSWSLVGKPWSFVDKDGNLLGVRILGVLQRIAICYFFASVLVYYFKRNGAIIISIILLLGYWAICYFGNPTDPFSMENWVGRQFDVNILSEHHIYKGEKINGKPFPFDPEGLLSAIAAIAQVILGYIVGKFIIDNGSTRKTVEKLLIIGLVLGLIGTLWNVSFPVNKKIWTSSYTVLTTGMATLFIAIFIYLFEILKTPQIFGKFFDAFGKNPLFIFVLSGALPRILGLIRIPNGLTDKGVQKFASPFGWLYEHVFKNIGVTDLTNLHSEQWKLGSFLYAIAMIIFYWLIAYIMDKKKIYVKV